MSPQNNPFSFHCMICFEEFHPDERFPVVLPCGHTYVCNVCANRLDKCMECRMPLYTVVRTKQQPGGQLQGGPTPQAPSQAGTTAGNRSSWSSARSGVGSHRTSSAGDSSSPKAQPPVKKRLPLPKNVVLLSLIEATELATQDVHKKDSDISPRSGENATIDGAATANPDAASLLYDSSGRPAVYPTSSILDVEEEEEEKIKVGTSLAMGIAGTYAVAVREGMEIYPSRPQSSLLETTEEDVDAVVDQNINDKKKDSPRKSDLSENRAKLSFGDRVQVVSLDGSWAKLARGYGYVKADRNNLVKGTFKAVQQFSVLGSKVLLMCSSAFLFSSLTPRSFPFRCSWWPSRPGV